MRRPATAVMFATAIGNVVPTPSGVPRSTSKRDGTDDSVGTRNTSLYVSSYGASCPGRRERKRIGAGNGTVPRVRTEPVVLVHGWGGSFEATWRAPGWEALLEDAGRRVIGVDLLGHG